MWSLRLSGLPSAVKLSPTTFRRIMIPRISDCLRSGSRSRGRWAGKIKNALVRLTGWAGKHKYTRIHNRWHNCVHFIGTAPRPSFLFSTLPKEVKKFLKNILTSANARTFYVSHTNPCSGLCYVANRAARRERACLSVCLSLFLLVCLSVWLPAWLYLPAWH